MGLTQKMRVVREVARLGGFAAAARSLNISAPSVSRIVGDLEQELGVRLFLRTTRRFSLTEEGAMFISNPQDFTWQEARVGMPLKVAFRDCEDSGGSFRLPVFTPA